MRYNRDDYFRIKSWQLSSIGLSCLVLIMAMEMVCRGDKGGGKKRGKENEMGREGKMTLPWQCHSPKRKEEE